MIGYVFTWGVEGFETDVAPAVEEGCYLNFEKAFQHLVEINKDWIDEDFLKNSSSKTVEDYCKKYCINTDPYIGTYAMNKIEIYE